MSDCVFCRIAAGKLPAKKLYEDEWVLAFYDIAPVAPVHFLVVPKEHIPSAADLDTGTESLVGRIFSVIVKLTRDMKITDFRIVNNCGEMAGQTVPHLHFHVLAGVRMGCLL